MPLRSVNGPAEYVASEVRFAMTDPEDATAETLWVIVTMGTLDGLAPSDLSGRQMADWVERHRSAFEQIASAKYDGGLTLRITASDWMARFPMPA